MKGHATEATGRRRCGAWAASLLLGAAAVLAGCEHKDLCYDHTHTAPVDVVFDWSYAPDAERNNEVENMCLWFYPIDEEGNRTGDPIYRQLQGMKGGRLDLPLGNYCVLYYNSDYEAVLFRGTERFLTHECYTRSGNLFESITGNAAAYDAPRPEGTEGEPVVITPDKMWGDCAINVEVTADGHMTYWFIRDGETERTTITNDEGRLLLMPHEQVCDYSFEIRNVKNLEHVTQLSASLSGMAGSVFCAKEELTHQGVTLPLAALSDGASVITGQFHTFGHDEENDTRHVLTLYVWLKDGTKWYYTSDVTDQIEKAADRRNVHITVDGLELPKPIENGGGMKPDVDDWEEVEEHLEM